MLHEIETKRFYYNFIYQPKAGGMALQKRDEF